MIAYEKRPASVVALDARLRAFRQRAGPGGGDRGLDRPAGPRERARGSVGEEHLHVRGPARPVDEPLGRGEGHVEGVVVPRGALPERPAHDGVEAVDRPLRGLDHEGDGAPDADAQLPRRHLGHVDGHLVVGGKEGAGDRRLGRPQLRLAAGVDAHDPGDARAAARHRVPAHEDVRRGAPDAVRAALLLDPPGERLGRGQLVLAVGVERVVLGLEVVRPGDHLQVAGLNGDEGVGELPGDAVGEAGGDHQRGRAEGHRAPGERVPPLRAQEVAEGDREKVEGHTCRSASAGRIRAAMRAGPRAARTVTPIISAGTETRSGQARVG